MEASEDRDVTLNLRGQSRTFTGQHYLFHLALPNFYFHLTTAYGILRQNGIALGKGDFLGAS